MNDNMFSHIKQENNKVELYYHNFNSGCTLFAGFLLIAMCIAIYFILPNSIILALLGIVVSIIGLVFFGALIIKTLSVMSKGKTLVTIENNRICNVKHDIPLSDVTAVRFGWQFGVFKCIFLTANNKKTYRFSTYNFVPDIEIELFVDKFIVPLAAPNVVVEGREKLAHHHVQNMAKNKQV